MPWNFPLWQVFIGHPAAVRRRVIDFVGQDNRIGGDNERYFDGSGGGLEYSTSKWASMALLVFVLNGRTIAGPSGLITRPWSTAYGPTAEARLPQLAA